MQDKPGLKDDARRLASAGRMGDTIIAHINPKEAAILRALGGSGTLNPQTGALEFWDTDPMGGAADYGGDRTGQTSDMGYGGKDEGDRARDASRAGGIGGFNDSRTFGDRVSDWFGRQATNIGINARTAMNNPARTALNFGVGLLGGPIGWGNTLSGWMGGPTIGGGLVGMANAMGQNAPTAPPGQQGEMPSNGGNPFSGLAPADPRGGDPRNLVMANALR